MFEKLFKKKNTLVKPIPKIEGAVANVNSKRVSGWAYLNHVDLEGEILDFHVTEIEIFIDGKPVGKTTANLFRKDIQKNKNHPTGKCGFDLKLDKEYEIPFIQKNISVFANGIQIPNKFKQVFVLKKENKNEENFFFIHIPKTAGTSFRLMLYDIFDQKNIFPNLEDIQSNNGKYPKIQALKARSKDKQNEIKILSGHFPHSNGVIFPNKPKHLVFLRKPLNRAVSNLFHLQRLNEKHKDKSLEEIFEMSYHSVNCLQVRYLANAVGKKNLTQNDLNIAKENLRNCHFLGITERFDESIDAATKVFGWDFPKKRKDNVNHHKNYDLLSDELLLKIKEANKMDEELYNYALELFDQFIADPSKYIAGIKNDSNNRKQTNAPKKAAKPKEVPQSFKKPSILKDYKPVTEKTKCTIDWINIQNGKEGIISINSTNLSIKGWAIDLPNKKIADKIYLTLGSNHFIEATNNIERNDVAEKFNNKIYTNAGFSASKSIVKMENGTYELNVLLLNSEKKTFINHSTGISIKIARPKAEKDNASAKKTASSTQVDTSTKTASVEKNKISNDKKAIQKEKSVEKQKPTTTQPIENKVTVEQKPTQSNNKEGKIEQKNTVDTTTTDQNSTTNFYNKVVNANEKKSEKKANLKNKKGQKSKAKNEDAKANSLKNKKKGGNKNKGEKLNKNKPRNKGNNTKNLVKKEKDKNEKKSNTSNLVKNKLGSLEVSTKKNTSNKKANNNKKQKSGFVEPLNLDQFTETGALPKLKWKLNKVNINANTVSSTIKIEEGVISITGSAMDFRNNTTFEKIFILIDSTKYYQAQYGLSRNTKSQSSKNKTDSNSGFKARIPVDDLRKGYHSLTILALEKDQKSYRKSSRRVVIEII